MLKTNNNLEVGMRIILPETWHERIVQFVGENHFPYEFKIEKCHKTYKDIYYICKSEKDNGKYYKIALTEYAIKYILAQEVPDVNSGLSFDEYLPMEGTTILITNCKNPSEVISGVFTMEAGLVEIDDKSLVCIDFKIYFSIGNGFASVSFYNEGTKKYTWKFVMNDDESYMTEYEKMYKDTITHKMYVIESCNKLARYLEKEGAVEHAKALRERAKVHDNSKLCCEDELHALSRIINDKSSLRDYTIQLSPIKQDAIRLHWLHNTHHPEHFASPIDMSRIDIMEMCCDWHARSAQYKSDFLTFIKNRQNERFHFPEWMFVEILHYCEVLDSKFV